MGQLVTAEKAKEKWCRHSLIATVIETSKHLKNIKPGTGAVNRFHHKDNEDLPKCVGESCMSWDWWDEETMGKLRRGYCAADGVKPNKIGNEKSKEEFVGYG